MILKTKTMDDTNVILFTDSLFCRVSFDMSFHSKLIYLFRQWRVFFGGKAGKKIMNSSFILYEIILNWNFLNCKISSANVTIKITKFTQKLIELNKTWFCLILILLKELTVFLWWYKRGLLMLISCKEHC